MGNCPVTPLIADLSPGVRWDLYDKHWNICPCLLVM